MLRIGYQRSDCQRVEHNERRRADSTKPLAKHFDTLSFGLR